jgi:acyl-CoA reductase-like NAD-dependent aldehyde dehydrogenase
MSISQEAGPSAAPVPYTPTQLFVAGEWRDAADGTTFADISPTSEQVLAHIAHARAEDVNDAVVAARLQIDGGELSQLAGADRWRLLYRLADVMERDAEIFVALEATMSASRPSSRAWSTSRTPSTRFAISPAGPTRSRAAG